MADTPYLPEHIIQKIFQIMPTKPLVQLKCLSKHWNRVISHPSFMKSRSRRMIFIPTIPFHAIDNTETCAPSMIKLRFPFDRESFEETTIVGSFNGIILLAQKDCSMILYNPFSGEFKTVPYPPSFDSRSNYVYGFGYGTTEDDLKIVRLRDFSNFSYSKSSEVFSLKTWSWSKPSELIGDYCFSGSYSGTFANGFLYWDAVRKRNLLPLIVALDIKKMVFSEIEIPEGCWFNRLGTYTGRLCMICTQLNVKGWELRVMNEQGFGKSWSTVCSFESVLGNFFFLDDGKLLISKPAQKFVIYDMFKDLYKEVNPSQQLDIYDMFKDSFKDVYALTSFRQIGRLQSVEYVESSISPSDICSV